MKRNDQQPGLLYHSLHRRVSLRGCLPIAFILAGLAVYGLLSTLQVVMPKRAESKGVGQVYYRNDELIHFQIRQRTPLPLNLPSYVDPARQEAAAAETRDGRALAKPLTGPAFDFLSVPPDSIVLSEADLLELPPDNWRASLASAPAAAPGEEEEPAEEEDEEESIEPEAGASGGVGQGAHSDDGEAGSAADAGTGQGEEVPS